MKRELWRTSPQSGGGDLTSIAWVTRTKDLPPSMTHLRCQFPGPLLSHEGLFWGPSSGVPARSWSLQSSWSVAHLSLDFVLSCWESRDTMSEGELITPESSVVSSEAKQLPTDTVSSASDGSGGTPSTPQGPPGPRGRLTGRDTQGQVRQRSSEFPTA